MVNTNYLHCEQCSSWAGSVRAREKEIYEGIRVGKENSDIFQNKLADSPWVFYSDFGQMKSGDKIEKDNRSVVKKKIEKEARRMIEWEVEGESRWDRVDSIE